MERQEVGEIAKGLIRPWARPSTIWWRQRMWMPNTEPVHAHGVRRPNPAKARAIEPPACRWWRRRM